MIEESRIQSAASQSLAELLLRAAERYPGATAVIGPEETLSYRDLNERADGLARQLRALGVRDGTPVGLLMERSVGLITGLVAVVKAGGCYVALDHRQPAGRTAALLRDAGAEVLITRGMYRGEHLKNLAQVIIDSPGPSAAPDISEQKPTTNLDAPAYIAYTSGSTGSPKGVCVPQRAVVRLVIDAKYLPIRPDDVFLQLAPVAFDASTLEIWGALLNGATLVIPPATDLTIRELTALVHERKVTVLFLTTGLFHQLSEADFERMSGLRYLLTGGEVVSVPQANKAVAALSQSVVIHAYGPTENTTFTTCYPITTQVTSAAVPLGPPIDGSAIYLLNEHLDPVPPGVAGELFATGTGLAHGYVNKPAVTAESFLPDPFAATPGALMYRTGDLARQLTDGSVEFLGRIDNQIKVRGFRVEPAEIEAVLRAHPEITNSCVVLQDFSATEKRLTAFYVSDEAIPTAELRRMLSEKLPHYMIPARFSRLGALPLKPSGKVDRDLITQIRPSGRPDVGSVFRNPGTPVEKWLSELWGDLLEINAVGLDDDFFELGGHSLMAIRITGEISAEFDVHISSREFYENPTVSEQASLLTGLGVGPVTHAIAGESAGE